MTQADLPKPSGAMVTVAALGTRAFSQFVLLLLLTRGGGIDSATDFILLTALIAPVQPVAELGLRLQFVLRPSAMALRPLLQLRLIGYGCLALAVGGVALQVGISPPIIIGVLLGKVADGVGDIAAGQLQRVQGLTVPSLVMLATSLASLVALVATSLRASTTEALPMAAALVSVCGATAMWGLVVRDFRAGRQSGIRASRRDIVWAGIGMGLGGSLAGLAASLPQFALGWAGEGEALTAFAYLTYCLTAADLMVNGLSQARLGQLAHANATGDCLAVSRLALRNSLGIATRISVPAVVGLLVTASLISRVTGVETHIGWLDLTLILVAILALPFPYMYASALTAMAATGQVLLAAMAGALTVGLVCVVVVPSNGLTGAALAVAVGGITRSGAAVWLLEVKVRR